MQGVGLDKSFIVGWRGVSKFASLGEIRSCKQSVSYEVEMAFFFPSFGNYLILFPIFIISFLFCIAEPIVLLLTPKPLK